jgi:peptidoglycan/LPS O-acetylase OafA/YrhL
MNSVHPTIAETPLPGRVDFKHFPVLDGLRGIAVLTVMCYHLELIVPSIHMLSKGGFLGVDLFFVLSGFLITSILLKEHDLTGSFSLINFYVRRTLRLVPALWFFLAAIYLAGNLILPPTQATLIYGQNNFLYSAIYVMNWHSAAGALTGNLNHIWSLAIEEQFYIIWSLLLFRAFRESLSRKQIAVGTTIIVAVLMIQRAIRAANGAPIEALYYSTDTRIDAILIGCLASMIYCWKFIPLAFFRTPSFERIALGSAVLACSIVLIFDHEDTALYFGFISLFSISVSIAILWLVTRERTLVHKLLETPSLRWLGQVSYSLYLWHYVFFEFAKSRFDNVPVQMIVGVSLSLAVAAFSFYLIERPLLNLKNILSANKILKKAELAG